MPALFQLGAIHSTQGALREIPPEAMTAALRRHVQGDWGEVGEEDARENDLSVREGFRILSAYQHNGRKFWLLTEADRSVTTILLPEEY